MQLKWNFENTGFCELLSLHAQARQTARELMLPIG